MLNEALQIQTLQDTNAISELLEQAEQALSKSDDIDSEEKKPKVKPKGKRKAKKEEDEEDYLPKRSSTTNKYERRKKVKKPKANNKVTKKSPTMTFQPRAALVDGTLIKSAKLEKNFLIYKLHKSWADKSHSRGIKKMFTEISKTRPLFRKHLQLVHGNILKFLIIEPFKNGTPETILNFIREQAKRHSTPFLEKLKSSQVFSHVEVEGEFAIFHITDEHQSPEDLIKINTALYNKYVGDKVFRNHFGTPTKNDRMPKMEIKQPLQGLSESEILNKLIAILNKKVVNDLRIRTLDEQSLDPLTPVLSSSLVHLVSPISTPLSEPEPEYCQDDFASLFNEQGVVQAPLTYQYKQKCTPSLGPLAEEDNDLLEDRRFRI